MEVKRQLFESSAPWYGRFPSQGEEYMEEVSETDRCGLNLGLENFGMKIEKATCTFTAGPTLVRFVAAEQEIVEKARPSPALSPNLEELHRKF